MTREEAKRRRDAAWDAGAFDGITDLLLAVERETAAKCAEICEEADVLTLGQGHTRTDYGRGTLMNAAREIRATFPEKTNA